MAIEKDVENEYGAEFNYHKLGDVRVCNGNKNEGVTLVMTVYSWKNKQARIDGKEPTVRQCIISNADFALTPFYMILKAKFPEFKDGLDDFDNSFKEFKGAAKGGPLFTEQTGKGKFLKQWQDVVPAEVEENNAADNENSAETSADGGRK